MDKNTTDELARPVREFVTLVEALGVTWKGEIDDAYCDMAAAAGITVEVAEVWSEPVTVVTPLRVTKEKLSTVTGATVTSKRDKSHKCSECDNLVSSRAITCSDACRAARSRRLREV